MVSGPSGRRTRGSIKEFTAIYGFDTEGPRPNKSILFGERPTASAGAWGSLPTAKVFWCCFFQKSGRYR